MVNKHTGIKSSSNKSADPVPLALDSLGTGLGWAFSLRKLRTAYTGNAIRVKRSSDNATQDIGFVGEALDESALTSFVGANTGYVTIWYDQSGNGRDLQTVNADGNSPRIVISGTLQTGPNGKAGVYFDSARVDRIWRSTTVAMSASCGTFGDNTTFLVYKITSTPGNYIIMKHGDSSNTPALVIQVPYSTDIYYDHGNQTGAQLRANVAYPSGYFDETYHILGCRALSETVGGSGNSVAKIRFNGTELFTETFTGSQSNGAKRFSLGANYAGGTSYNTPYKGIIQEAIVWATDIGATALSDLETNATTYWTT